MVEIREGVYEYASKKLGITDREVVNAVAVGLRDGILRYVVSWLGEKATVRTPKPVEVDKDALRQLIKMLQKEGF